MSIKYWHKLKHNIYGDTLEVVVKDGNYKPLYRAKCNTKDIKKFAQIIRDLEKFHSIDSVEILKEILKARREEAGWFLK